MRTIIHLSDIHFGRVDYALIEPLIELIHNVKPDLTVISGDLTQRARSWQFQEARAFLDKLPDPQIVVPGNHDIPLYHAYNRFLRPLDKYRRFITDDLQPFYSDDEIAVIGINTARSLTTKYGRINERQIAAIREKMCELDDKVFKIIVTHHPFDLPPGFAEHNIVGRAQMAMQMIANCGADLFLAGHIHVSHIGHTAKRYKTSIGKSALLVQAGTATSTRGRGESNAFNVLRLEHPHIAVERIEWNPEENRFFSAEIQKFAHARDGWRLASGDV